MQHLDTGIGNQVEQRCRWFGAAGPVVMAKPRPRFRDLPLRGVINDGVIPSAHDNRHHAANGIDILYQLPIAPAK
jgi:hypothetical protein